VPPQRLGRKTLRDRLQYLSKPCHPVDLIKSIDQALAQRDVPVSEGLKAYNINLESLPVFTPLYGQLVEALQNYDSPIRNVGDIKYQDVAMSASIMRLVNSSFFGIPTHVSSIYHAVNLLWTQTLGALVLSTQLFATIKNDKISNFSFKLLWEHSLRVACFAKIISEEESAKTEVRDDCFIAGLLHDVGKLILATNVQSEFEKVLLKVRAENIPVNIAEQEVLGVLHTEVGGHLMGLWGFNELSVESICWHHDSKRQVAPAISSHLAVYVANSFDHDLVKINPMGNPPALSGD